MADKSQDQKTSDPTLMRRGNTYKCVGEEPSFVSGSKNGLEEGKVRVNKNN